MDKRPRVLVTSIPCWNNRTGSDTLSSLLEGYGENEIANIYFKSDVPNSQVCNNYFCISEGAVLRSIIQRGYPTGKKVAREGKGAVHQRSSEENSEKKRYSFWLKHRSHWFLLAREFAWLLGKWKSKELVDYVEEFDPDVLFFPIESYIYFNRVNEWLIKKTKRPAIGFIWDDNYTYISHRGNVGFMINRLFTRRSVKRMVKRCDTVFVITPKMKREYDKLLGINSVLLTKGVSTLQKADYCASSKPYHIIYAGKLSYGREDTLVALAKAIKQVNAQQQNFILDIYSQTTPSENAMKYLNCDGCSCFHGKIEQTEVATVLQSADILLIVEALEGENANVARLSFSTKVTDCLSKGKCILLIAPKDNATTEYLTENQAAVVATSPEEIRTQLIALSEDSFLMEKYGNKAYQLVQKNHLLEDKQKTLFAALSAANKKFTG